MNAPPITLTVLIATAGRPGLAATLASLESAGLSPYDELVIAMDGPPEIGAVKGIERAFQKLPTPPTIYRVEKDDGTRHNDWGHTPRNLVMHNGWCSRDYIVHMDDDDTFTEGALERIRWAIANHETPNVPHMFRMDHNILGTLWRAPVLAYGNVGTPMFVAPNNRARLGTFPPVNGGDFAFMCATADLYGGPDSIVWNADVIAKIKPN